jgi:V/A-type H+-transporting ATPase subunit D
MTLALNKSSLKQQHDQLGLFRKFLPSLDLKRQQLLAELKKAEAEYAELRQETARLDRELENLYPLMGSSTLATRDLSKLVRFEELELGIENVAGEKLPALRALKISVLPYSTLATPFWVDLFVDALRRTAELRARMDVQTRRVAALQAAGRRVTQRVNLFDKVLIPESQKNIQRIRIFLADQERSAVVRSKIAKSKG